MAMMKESLYILLAGFGMDSRFYAGGHILQAVKKCEVCSRTLKNQTIESGTKFELAHLGRLGFSPILWNLQLILREDIVQQFMNANLTGFDLNKLTISGWYEKPKKLLPEKIPQYYQIVTKGRLILKEPPKEGETCPKCGGQTYAFPKSAGAKLEHGVVVDMESWDGSDIATLEGYTMKFFSEKAVRVALEAGLGKFSRFVRVEKYLTWESFDLRIWDAKRYQEYQDSFMIKNIEDINQK